MPDILNFKLNKPKIASKSEALENIDKNIDKL